MQLPPLEAGSSAEEANPYDVKLSASSSKRSGMRGHRIDACQAAILLQTLQCGGHQWMASTPMRISSGQSGFYAGRSHAKAAACKLLADQSLSHETLSNHVC